MSSVGDTVHARGPIALPKTLTPIQASYFVSHFDRDWLNPIAMATLKSAVEKRADHVTLNGIQYSLEYIVHNYPLTGDREEVKLKRKDGYMAPFGYIGVKRILEFEFEATS